VSKNLNIFKEILLDAKTIRKEYDLCDNCLGRLFAKKLSVSSNKKLGEKIRKNLKTKIPIKCYVCKNLLQNISSQVEKINEISSAYQFSTFLVGITLKPSVIDRDDAIRSKFKLKGIDSVKTDITKELAKSFARKTKTKIDSHSPEITFTLNFKDDSQQVRAKSIYLYGRYTKKIRGLSQKQKQCYNCKGKGCTVCKYHGIQKFDSVEGKLALFLYKKFGIKQVKFSWLGGEDKSSLVLGTGRPFFAKILDPKIRRARLGKNIPLDNITICNAKIITQIPKEPIHFRSQVKMSISTINEIQPGDLKILQTLKQSPVLVSEKFEKQSKKTVYGVNYKKISSNSFSLFFVCRGRISVQKIH